jgi:hypothetical protein
MIVKGFCQNIGYEEGEGGSIVSRPSSYPLFAGNRKKILLCSSFKKAEDVSFTNGLCKIHQRVVPLEKEK